MSAKTRQDPSRRGVLRMGCAALAGLLLPRGAGAAPADPPARPNILFVFSDDHSLQTIGAYDARLSEFCRAHGATPNIDRLAREGALFRNSFCGNSLCSPSRATVLTGLHSHAHGVVALNKPVAANTWTFPGAMRAAGYQTAIVGKWHLGNTMTDGGFDHWRITQGQGGSYWNPEFVGPDGKQQYQGHTSDVTTDLGLKWLEGRDRSRPFMLMVQHKAPHRPWMPPSRHYRWLEDVQVPEPPTLFDDYSGRASPAGAQKMQIGRDMTLANDLKVVEPGRWPNQFAQMTEAQRREWAEVFGPRNEAFRKADLQGEDLTRWKYQQYVKDYLRCVRSVDDSVGRLLQYLDEHHLAQNTVVIYCSDQGFYNGEHGWFDKRWIYEESLHMPFIVRWPGVVAPGSRPDAMIQNIDYAPTFVEIAGGTVPQGLHGRSLLPVLQGRTPPDWRQSVYYHYYYEGKDHAVVRHEGVRTPSHTLANFYTVNEWELYDLHADSGQMRNIAANPASAGTLAQLKAELGRLRAQYGVSEPRAED